jgi:2-polyprenyl-3-methyl-5-hydroxy-6-metoxy-1,4-benzoquinol methylase
MARHWNDALFESSYKELVVAGTFNEAEEYYPRYKSRYKDLLVRYAQLAPEDCQDVLDVGGGQFALLCHAIWGDRAFAADIGGKHLEYLNSQGITTKTWNLCSVDQPFEAHFDFIFFSEVIEHLPIPGHIVLERLRLALKQNGTIICSTPNLYRLRNIVYMFLGKQIFDYFRMPTDRGLGHVLEYSVDHLRWQLLTAGFRNPKIVFVQMHHLPNNIAFRLMYWLGSPLFFVPRFRDNLVAIASR